MLEMKACRRSKTALVSVMHFVQQPLQPHVFSKCAEFRLDAGALERECPPHRGRALEEYDRGVGVSHERVRGGGVAREGLVSAEAHASIERFDRQAEQRLALAGLTERQIRGAETDVELDD